MSKQRGRFIVIEGLDGAGTPTQAKRLADQLTGAGRSSWLTCEPTDEPVGKLIRDALSGRIVSPGSNKRVSFGETALCLLFAADRIEHSREIERWIKRGKNVVCDRYILSSIAYQSLDPSISAKRVVEVNRGCAIPDLTILLDVPVKECLTRLKNRKDSPTVYEKKELLKGIRRNYAATRKLYKKHFGRLVTIDGAGTIDEVHEAIVDAVGGLVGV
jgi:dTMP kinase